MRILVGKEGYSRPQAYAISLSYWEKEGQNAQQGVKFNNPVPQNIGYSMPSFSGLPTTGYEFNYNNNFNPQPVENNTSFGQNQFSNSAYSVPNEIGYNYDPQKSFSHLLVEIVLYLLLLVHNYHFQTLLLQNLRIVLIQYFRKD